VKKNLRTPEEKFAAMRRANGGLGNERRPAFESGISVVAVVA